jgi:hypothetical protein
MLLTAAAPTVPLWVAVALALASPIVAIGVAWFGAHQHTLTLRHERQRDDLSEVRRVLECCAERVARCSPWEAGALGAADDSAVGRRAEAALALAWGQAAARRLLKWRL